MLTGSSVYIELPFLVDCRPRLKSDSPAHETRTILIRHETGVSRGVRGIKVFGVCL